jgi:hypothetical protein
MHSDELYSKLRKCQYVYVCVRARVCVCVWGGVQFNARFKKK